MKKVLFAVVIALVAVGCASKKPLIKVIRKLLFLVPG